MSKRAFASWLAALVLLGLAALSMMLRLGVPLVPDLSQQLLREIHARSGVIVNADRLRLDWQGRNLVIEAQGVRATRDNLNLSADLGYLQLDLLRSWNDGQPRLKRVAFDRLVLQVPDAPQSERTPLSIEQLLGAAFAPLEMADEVHLTQSMIQGEGWQLGGLDGVLAKRQGQVRIRLDGDLKSAVGSGSLNLNLAAKDAQISGVVDHQLRGSVDYLGQSRALNVQGRAWISLSSQSTQLDWIGQANSGPITLNGRFQVAGGGDQPWLGQTENLVADIDGQRLEIGQINGRWDGQQWGLSTGAFEVPGIPLALESWLPQPLGSNLISMQPSLSIQSSVASGQSGEFRAHFQTGQGQALAYQNIPGGRFQSAKVSLENWTGIAELQGIRSFHPASAYASPIPLNDGAGRLSWTRDKKFHWRLVADQIAMQADDLDLTGRFTARLQPKGGVFDLALDFDSRGLPAQSRVPLRFLGEAGQAFWQSARPSFSVEDGELRFQRENRQNQITLQADFADAGLTPAQGWPGITQGAGALALQNGDVVIDIASGQFANESVTGRVVRADGRWRVTGDALIGQPMRFIDQLPLDLAAVTGVIATQDPIQGSVDLNLGNKISGDVTLNLAGGQWTLLPLDLPIRDLTGQVEVNLDGTLAETELAATIWDRPSLIRLQGAANGVDVSADVDVPLSWATQRFAAPLSPSLSGRAPARVNWSTDGWQVLANLAQDQMALPAPLNAIAGQFTIQGAGDTWSSIEFSDALSLRQSGSLIVGRSEATDLIGWAQIMGGFTGEGNASEVELQISQAQVGELDIGPLSLIYQNDQVVLEGPRARADIALADPIVIEAGEIRGRVMNPDQPGVPSPAPSELPDIDLAIKRLTLVSPDETTDVFNLASQIRSDATDVRFNGLSLTLGGALMQGSASWSKVQPSSGADLRIRTQDLGELLAARGLGRPLETEQAEIDVTLDWADVPWAPDMNTATGIVRIETAQGRLLDSPTSAEALRIFGILNVGSLTRRLRLDFSDLIEPGLAFDRISGEARLRNGQLDMVVPLELDGPSATMLVTGSSNLATGVLDHQLKVQVPLSSQLPAAALLAGFPAIAAGVVLLVDQVAGDNLKRIGETNYQISGTFEAPQITPLKVEETQ